MTEVSDLCLFFSVTQQPNTGLGSIAVEVSRPYTVTHTHTVELLWTSDQFVAEAVTYTTNNIHKRRTFIPSTRFEPAIPSIKRLPTHTLFASLLSLWVQQFDQTSFLLFKNTWHFEIFRCSRILRSLDGKLFTDVSGNLWVTSSRVKQYKTVCSARLGDATARPWQSHFLVQNGV